jgi:acetylornithine/N-succinyldiaminopimelate aminotransferase
MTAGTHGSTYGGNPLAMAVGNAVLDLVADPALLAKVEAMGLLLKQRLAELKDRHPAVIAEIRGKGLLMGIRTLVPNTELVAELREEHLLTIGAGDNVVRLLPPLIIDEDDIAEAVKRIDKACTTIEMRLRETAKTAAE